ncbi:MAG: hypothetical protein V3U29_10070 [Phycisphaeraceae bacterium]
MDPNRLTQNTQQALHDAHAEAGYDPLFGARPLKRYLQHQLETRIGRTILAGDVGEGAAVTVAVDDGQLAVKVTPADASTSPPPEQATGLPA